MVAKKDKGQRIEYQFLCPRRGRISLSIDPTKPVFAALQEVLMDMTDGLGLPLEKREEITRKSMEYALRTCPALAKVPADEWKAAQDREGDGKW